MRIISGKFGGRPLSSVVAGKGVEVRPTQDRIRGAIFNMIQFEIEGARVCDLFAGTGAMGIEALSRDASFCTFVEQNPKVSKGLQKNLELLGVERTSFELLTLPVESFFTRSHSPYQIIFMDPPYRQNLVSETLSQMSHSNILSPGGLLVVEHALDEKPLAAQLTTLEIIKEKEYGGTAVTIFAKRS